ALEYSNNKVYMAIGSTVQVFNVTTPTAPSLGTPISLSGTANKLALNSNFLFVADSDDAGELVRINLSTLAQVKYNASGNEDGTAVFVSGGNVYLGRTSQSNPDLLVLDASGASISLLGSKNLNHQNNSNVVDIVVAGQFAFIASGSANKELEVYDVSAPASITQKCTSPSVNPTNVGFGLTFFENYVYMAMRANSELAIFADHP
ncbi:MAG TPA: hypothetical protein VHQ20_00350, partial [Patescibacteria group bacterium]|nr:hypothetical protein [Patescibacteria group bacterium]